MWDIYNPLGFTGSSAGEESACNMGDLSSISGLGISPGRGHGNPLQYSCLENPHGQRALVGYSPWGHKELDLTEPLSLLSLGLMGFPGKESTCNIGSIPGLGRSPGGGHDNPLQYSCLENPHGQRSLVGYRPRCCRESDMTE